MRALVDQAESAEAWLGGRVTWPALIYAEVAHAVLRLRRNRLLQQDESEQILHALHTFRADVRSVESLTRTAWDVALERGLTVYDACYVVLAEALGAPLVTADRRVAEATPNAVLLA